MLLEAIFIFLRIVKASYKKGVEGKVVPIGSAICYGKQYTCIEIWYKNGTVSINLLL